MVLVFYGKQTDAPEPVSGLRGFSVVVFVHEIFKRLADDCS